MNIGLKNVKYFEAGSEETLCFVADIVIDGVEVGSAKNDGHGGMTHILPWELADRLNAYAKTLPPKVCDVGGGHESFTYAQQADTLIDDLVSDWLIARDFERKMKRRILFIREGKRGVYESKAAKDATQLQMWLLHPKTKETLGADVILNGLPKADALKLYRENAA